MITTKKTNSLTKAHSQNGLTPEELERFAEAEETSKSAHKAIIDLRHRVLARELPGWQHQLTAEEEQVAYLTSQELMRLEEEAQYQELMRIW